MMKAGFIGIDGGGTKTAGLLIDQDGRIIKQVQYGPTNYQAVGLDRFKEVLSELLKELLDVASDEKINVKSIGYGLSGLDRPQDEDRIMPVVEALSLGFKYTAVNDTYLILRAGSVDYTGVAVVSGTGSNCVGRNSDGKTYRIGGLCFEMGDFGSGWDIAVAGLRAAKRGTDGRGPKTLIHDLIIEAMEFKSIDDAMDFLIECQDPSALYEKITPIVFQAAAKGDMVAIEILTLTGRELGMTASLVASHLFDIEEAFNCVVGGSVLMSDYTSIMRKALETELNRRFPNANVVRLKRPPVYGAVLLAAQMVLSPQEVNNIYNTLIFKEF